MLSSSSTPYWYVILGSNSVTSVDLLPNTLQTEATPAVIDLIARGNAGDFATGDTSALRNPNNRQSLLAMKALLDAQLSRMDVDEEELSVAVKASSSARTTPEKLPDTIKEDTEMLL